MAQTRRSQTISETYTNSPSATQHLKSILTTVGGGLLTMGVSLLGFAVLCLLLVLGATLILTELAFWLRTEAMAFRSALCARWKRRRAG